MLPDFLVGTFRQYKEDTNTIAVWLGATARSYGWVPHGVLNQVEEQKVTKKSKSKSKSKPKTKKQQRDAARRIPSHQRKLVIQITDFVPLAEHISQHIKAPSRVPPSILATLERAIEVRQECGSWYKNNRIEDFKNGHAYFIAVLQKVREILKPHAVLHETSSDDEATLVDNIFQNLAIEEPSQEFLAAPGVAPKQDTNSQDRMVYEFVDQFMGYLEGYLEGSFAAAALFKDVNRIYSQAEQLWHQYRDDKVDLMTASLTSNTAIDLIRQLEDDFFTQFPRFRKIDHDLLKNVKKYDPSHKDAQQLINVMFRVRCVSKGMSPCNEQEDDDEVFPTIFNLELYDEAQYLFLDMLEIMCHYVNDSQNMKFLCWRPGSLGQWDPDTDHAKLPNKEKHRDNTRILAELLPDLWIFSTSTTQRLGEDEMTKSCRNLTDEFGGQAHLHIWSLAAARLFCNIHHILGLKIWKPFDTVQRLAGDAKATLADCFAARDRGEANCWPPEADAEVARSFTSRMDSWLFTDELKAEVMHAARNVKGYKKPDYHLFRRHPLICGIFEFNIRTGMQEMGIFALEHLHTGAMVAHLYNAVQREGFCEAEWRDMEFFIELQTVERLFVGGRPKSPEEYFQRVCLYKGASPQTFAANRRKNGMIMSKRGSRITVPSGGIINLFKFRHSYDSGYEECVIFLNELEEMVDAKYDLSRVDPSSITVSPRSLSEVMERKHKSSYKNSRYSPTELLILTQFALTRDVPAIKFDYLFFHKCCFTVLHAVYNAVDQASEGIFGPIFLQGEDNFSQLVPCVLSLSMPLKQLQKIIKLQFPFIEKLPLRVKSILDQREILKRVGQLMQNKIQNGRFHSQTNSRVRQMQGMSEMLVYSYQEDTGKGSRVTFKKHKPTFHRSAFCTREYCVCGANSKAVKKNE